MDTNIFSTFVQDDWQIAPTVKVLYGLRYDLYQYPAGLADAPLTQTQAFNIDKNNFGPRVGVAWSVDAEDGAARQHRHHVRPADSRRLRAGAAAERIAEGAGLHASAGTAAGAPAFPSTASSTGTLADAVAVGGRSGLSVVAHTWQTNVQLERSFGRDFTASVGFMYANGDQPAGRHRRQPDQPDRHARRRPADLQPHGERGDARSIRGSTTSTRCSRSATRRSRSMTLQVSKRFAQGADLQRAVLARQGHSTTRRC